MKTIPTNGQAIKAMCKSCIHDPQESGTWVGQVQDCTSITCPLYPVRPLPTASDEYKARVAAKSNK